MVATKLVTAAGAIANAVNVGVVVLIKFLIPTPAPSKSFATLCCAQSIYSLISPFITALLSSSELRDLNISLTCFLVVLILSFLKSFVNVIVLAVSLRLVQKP